MTATAPSDTARLSVEELQRLAPLLDTLIPADDRRGLPRGADVRFGERCVDGATLSTIRTFLAALATWSGAPLQELPPTLRVELVKRCEREYVLEFRELLKQLVATYYLDDRVMRAIGVEPRAPFPEGHAVHDGDLTLLEAVYERGPIYRAVGDLHTPEESR